jgi:hypothetical protein
VEGEPSDSRDRPCGVTHFLSLTAEFLSPIQLRYDSVVLKTSSVIRYVWAASTTALGLVLVLAGLWRAQLCVVDGVVEAHGPALAWLLSHFTLMPGGAAALTLGHVVLSRDRWSLQSTRAQERVHVRQCEVWGPLFVPAYLLASLSATLRGRNFYFDNRFEREAFHAVRNESEAEAAQLGVASPVILWREDRKSVDRPSTR